jgi:hypothetical protein
MKTSLSVLVILVFEIGKPYSVDRLHPDLAPNNLWCRRPGYFNQGGLNRNGQPLSATLRARIPDAHI